MITRYLLVWFLLAVVAIVNGIVRQSTYGKIMPELAAHQLSTVTAVVVSGMLVFGVSRVWPLASAGQAWTIGVLWLLMTIAFEFGFGHFIADQPWHRLLADYNLLAGRLWLLFLAWITVMPWLFFRLAQAQ